MNWLAVYPEIVLLAMACVVALVDLCPRPAPRRTVTYRLTQADAGRRRGAAALVLQRRLHGLRACSGMFVADPMGHLLGLFATLAVMVTLVYARPYAAERDMLEGRAVHAGAVRAARHAGDDLGATTSWSIYLGLELMSLSLYALVALRRDHAGGDRGGDEVFRARRAGQRLPAVRHVDDVRRHRLARHRARSSRRSAPARSTARC